MNAAERLARWTAPLGASPADARQHPSFDAIRSEVAKLESPSGGSVDWAEVIRLADGFLAETGRDLIVASALASALSHREGIAGITLGAQLMARLLADPASSPTRARARANAIASFGARAELALEGSADRTHPSLDALASALRELNTQAGSLGDDAPSLRPLEERVRRAAAALPVSAAPTPPPVFVAPPPAMTAPAPIFSPSVDALPDRAEQVPAFVRRVSGQLVAAAALTRSASPLDADALRTTLAALYLPISSAPETTRESRTALPAPPKLVLETLQKQCATGAPETVVRDAIGALERSRFSLDVHAVLATALERAGATRALAIHRHEVVGLFARLPELLDREFADGTRFASAETRERFTETRAVAVAPTSALDPLDALRSLARVGRAADALALGTELRAAATSGRARFDATFAMALVAEDARALPLALELHADLREELDRHALDSWEPTLAAAVLRAAARIAPASDPARAAFARLARLDARAAFEISSSKDATPPKPGR